MSPGQPPTLSSRRARARPHARAHPTLSLSGSHRGPACPTAANRPHLSSAAAGRSAVHIAILGRHPRRPRTWGRRPDRDARRAEPSTSRRATSRGSAPSSAPRPPDLPPTSPKRTTGTSHPRSPVHPSQPTPPPTRTAATTATSRRHPATSSGRLRRRQGQQGGQGQPQAKETSQESRERRSQARGGRSQVRRRSPPVGSHVFSHSGPGRAMDEAVAQCASCDVIAVDCEGVNMSRVGPVTLLQVATDTDAYLFDVQAMGRRASRWSPTPPSRTVRTSSPCSRTRRLSSSCSTAAWTRTRCFINTGCLSKTSLTSSWRMSPRRRNHHAVSLLSGMPKCAARWLPKGANQAEANLAANDGKGGFDPSAPPDAVSIARVTEHLKRKV